MTSLYEVLKRSKTAPQLAPDMFTALWAKSITAEKTIELSGQVPLSFKANGKPLLDYLIIGNTVQSGTPTPDNPIMPQGTGERTGNLFDYQTMAISEENSYLKPDGSIGASNDWNVTDFIPCDGTEFTLSYVGGNTPAFCLYDGNKQYITGKSYNTGGASIKWAITITSQTVAKYIRFSYCKANPPSGDTLSSIMLNTGDTALPYEPWGIKIPISSASTTTPVYLGEVQTTRRVKKLVLDGTENWSFSTYPYLNGFITYSPNYLRQKINICVCSHLQTSANVQSGETIVPDTCCFNVESPEGVLYYKDTSIPDLASFKSWLAQQYAAGTPLTVWYVLATETTGIVNEPLRKIGDYADMLSKEQAGVQIPTNNGSTTLDVLTAVKPSNVSIKYRV